MKIYLKTWCQLLTHTKFLWINRIELQHLAFGFLTSTGASYTALNADFKRAPVVDNDIWQAIDDMRHKSIIFPTHKPVQMWNAFFQHCMDVLHEEPLEIVGYGMDLDHEFLKKLFRVPAAYPNELFKRVKYTDLMRVERDIAHLVPDDVMASLESPFEMQIIKSGKPYTLTEKINVLRSHMDYPTLTNYNLIQDLKAIEWMDVLFTSLIEQYA